MDLDTEVGKFLYPTGCPTREQRRCQLARQLDGTWPSLGGVWVVEWQRRDGFLGWCGLFPLEDSGLIEIGYRYVPGAWGQGVASEAAHCVLDYGFTTLGLETIVAVTHPQNHASQRVLGKIGLEYVGLREHYGMSMSFFHCTKEKQRQGSPYRVIPLASPS